VGEEEQHPGDGSHRNGPGLVVEEIGLEGDDDRGEEDARRPLEAHDPEHGEGHTCWREPQACVRGVLEDARQIPDRDPGGGNRQLQQPVPPPATARSGQDLGSIRHLGLTTAPARLSS